MNRIVLLSLLALLNLGVERARAAATAVDNAADTDIGSLVERFIERAAALPGYQMVMSKQQRIGRELSEVETILIKHRRDPECRYFKWLEKPHKNRQAIYCQQRYDGKMRVHEPILMGLNVSVDPDGLLARRGNLRPVQQSGIYNMARMLKADALRRAADHTQLPAGVDRMVDGQASLCLRRDEVPGDESATYPVAAGELCFDKLSAMPTQVRFWHRDGRLMEDYRFRDWVLDVMLSDTDFDTKNPDYGF